MIAAYAGRRVPRYTSYPTAPHFTPAVDAERYGGWLAELDPAAPLSLYLHVPFCRTMCWYCGCHTKLAAGDQPVDDYMAALRREIGLAAERLPNAMTAVHVHWGGGTPTIVSPDEFLQTMELLRRRFRLAADAEIAVEIDPRRLDGAMASALAAGGVNRASLGVQSFDPEVQRAVNREQSFAQTAEACAALRGAGIAALSFDLLYGLPHQTVASCADTAEQALSLAPDRVSVFGYAHVPWMKKHQRLIDEAALPDGLARIAQFEAIAERLLASGYRRIGLDHFARPEDGLAQAASEGGLRRNFQGYTRDPAAALLGFGASAIGALPQGHAQNLADTRAYKAAVAAGRLPTARGVELTAEDRLRRDAIEQIMCRQQVDLAETAARHGRPADSFASALPALQRLEQDGVIRRDGWRVAVEPDCALLMRNVAAAFDAYLEPSEQRHAASL